MALGVVPMDFPVSFHSVLFRVPITLLRHLGGEGGGGYFLPRHGFFLVGGGGGFQEGAPHRRHGVPTTHGTTLVEGRDPEPTTKEGWRSESGHKGMTCHSQGSAVKKDGAFRARLAR